MARLKWVLGGTVVLFFLAVIFGYSQKETYTDISREQGYLDELYVAQIPKNIALSTIKVLREELPLAPNIIRVEAIADVEHLAGTSRQLVKVKHIFQGDELEEEQEIYITCDRWSLSLYAKPYSIERGFVNVMKTGKNYLLFVDEQIDGLGEKTPVFQLYGETAIAPVFSYETHENEIGSMGKESTYVPYNQVKDNEFFATTPEAMDEFLELKKELFGKYCESNEGNVQCM